MFSAYVVRARNVRTDIRKARLEVRSDVSLVRILCHLIHQPLPLHVSVEISRWIDLVRYHKMGGRSAGPRILHGHFDLRDENVTRFEQLPRDAFRFVDRPYVSDMHLPKCLSTRNDDP